MNSILISAIEAASAGCVVDDVAALVQESKPEIDKAEERLLRLISGEIVADDPDMIVRDFGCVRQSLGFENGFRLGVRLMAECFTAQQDKQGRG